MEIFELEAFYTITQEKSHNSEISRLDIGSTSRLGTYILPHLLEGFQEFYPNVEITI